MIFPDCFTRWGGSQYLNSTGDRERYEDYVCDELIPFAEERFSLQRPPWRDRQVARADMAPCGCPCGGPGCFTRRSAHSVRTWASRTITCPVVRRRASRVSPEFAFASKRGSRRSRAREKKAGVDFNAMGYVAMCACYSPDPDAPFGFAFPVDHTTGETIPEFWARWLAADPVEMVETQSEGLRALEWLFLDCGSRDEWRSQLGLRRLTARLDSLGIPYESEEFPDGHRDVSYRYDVSLPKLAAALHRAPASSLTRYVYPFSPSS